MLVAAMSHVYSNTNYAKGLYINIKVCLICDDSKGSVSMSTLQECGRKKL